MERTLNVNDRLERLLQEDARVRRLLRHGGKIIHTLQEAGHEAYFVGGCVRDILLGRSFGEVDITTSAAPDQVSALFRRTIPVGLSFGVVAVVIDREPYEVATFRCEEGYADGRHPDRVRPGTLAEDVCRRDFTVNGLVLDPETGTVRDLVGGLDDLDRKRIRAIGVPLERMTEDYLRTLRAVRFSACLDFALEPATLAAVRGAAAGLARISRERVRNELEKLCACGASARGLRLLGEAGLAGEVFAGLGTIDGDVVAEAARLLDAAPGEESLPRLAGAVVLARSPEWLVASDGASRAAREAAAWADSLRLSNPQRKQLAETLQVMACLAEMPSWRLGLRADLYRLAVFPEAAALARAAMDEAGRRAVDARCAERLSLPPERLDPPMLLRGEDLAAAGVPRGPGFGRLLRELSYRVVEGKIGNRDEALAWLSEAVKDLPPT